MTAVDPVPGEAGSIADPRSYASGAFDDHRPPDAALLGDCVHCGFCLPTCPTYVLWGEEMDSPRGRLYLMKEGLDGAPLDDAMVEHWDNCLGCMSCVTACPSGVRYDTLIEQTRAQVERHHERPMREKALRGLVFALFPHPGRLRLLRGPIRALQRTGLDRALRRRVTKPGGLLERMAPHLAAMERLTPPLQPAERMPARIPAQGTRRATVAMITGCVQDAFFPEVNAATARVLAAEGCEVVVPAHQGCCGALSVHNGREEEAQRYARAMIDTFEKADAAHGLDGVDYVVINAAGCGSTLKDYTRLLADDPAYASRAAAFQGKVRDIAEVLDELGPAAERHPLPLTVAYHDACHLAHAQGVRAQPRRLLAGIPGLEVREIADPEICCGSAGVYSILHPEAAAELGRRKAAAIVDTGAEVLVTANPGCLLQVASSIPASADLGAHAMGMAHLVEVLDASIRGLAPDRLRSARSTDTS
ncbi:(Fe-S)-binding protein [Nocardioides sp. DS6]|uniref:Glycolate oxidase iron-sulfur subunit n=1 Tax=Nocardioides eburneus TaxID=3231482 RepID=A0ABV3SY80_9ACTN